MTGEHTRGPWSPFRAPFWIVTARGDGASLVKVAEITEGAKAEANAHLIAAAPDLLAACEAMEACGSECTDEEIGRVAQQNRDAIAKARGVR